MSELCHWYRISRQAHYKQRAASLKRDQEEAEVVVQVRQLRARHRRMGTRKLQAELRPPMGRDRFFDVLRAHDLLIKPRRSKRPRTTYSGFWRCENLLEGLVVDRPNKAWVSITYVETESGFCYVSLITDVYSRRIMGYHASNSLRVEGSLAALKMAHKQAGARLEQTIHHSDRGIQYTCGPYREQLDRYRMRSSMGAVGNCYDNAIAERVNGILKQEYGLDGCFANLRQVRQALREAVWLYNHERPHTSLSYRKPEQVYREGLKTSLIH
ncbi:MAG: IS3 family transposase [Rhodothermaceae bacterium]|nr:IS3 family transposase [Rhodothermaceae bacterium]